MDQIAILDLFKAFKGYEEHENELLHHRTSWFITVQSVLVATFGFSLQKYYEVSEKLAELKTPANVDAALNVTTSHYKLFLVVITIIGVFAAASALVSVNAAISAQTTLRETWDREHRARAEKVGLPHISGGGKKSAEIQGSFSALILPVTFTLLWLAVAVLTVFDIRLV